jgi:ABC-type bacteriocin/lantibiotic exporter with double-glycine peptidase domain
MLRGLAVHGLIGAALLGGCYRDARPFTPASFDREPGWIAVASVPVIRQREIRDCGAAAAAMLLGYWGVPATQDGVRAASGASPDNGLRADFLRAHLREHGLQAFLFEGSFADLERELTRGRPVLVGVITTIANVSYSHYLIVVGVNRAREQIVVIDPADGVNVYSFGGFMRRWLPTRFLTIAVSPTPASANRI